MEQYYPLAVLLIGMAIVIGAIIALKINAFIALITGAMAVSLMAGGDLAEKISRVAEAFGSTAASIGVVIALAAVIGRAMMDSGAADRIVRMFLGLLGEKRTAGALMGSGFTLSVPVFFDTAFYLLVPLARSMYVETKRHYLKYLLAIVAGAAVTHTLVPPTPGPLFIASQLGVDLGVMILIGVIVAVPGAIVGLVFGAWLDKRMPIEMRPIGGEVGHASEAAEAGPPPPSKLPNLALALAPILLPIGLITANSVVKVMGQNRISADVSILEGTAAERYIRDGRLGVMEDGRFRVLNDGEWTAALTAASGRGLGIAQTFGVTNVIGNPNLSLLLSAAVAVTTLYYMRRPTRAAMARTIETALMDGGLIILITAAGGAFGGMLKEAQLAGAIQNLFGEAAVSGLPMLFFGFFIAVLIKIAQGSSTAAMIVTSGMVAAMLGPDSLGFHPVYLATAIGSGSLVGSWMNDSGFWIFAKMGGLTEVESLKSWTPLLVLLGVTGMTATVILALILPMG